MGIQGGEGVLDFINQYGPVLGTREIMLAKRTGPITSLASYSKRLHSLHQAKDTSGFKELLADLAPLLPVLRRRWCWQTPMQMRAYR